jgi:hypothetical protein
LGQNNVLKAPLAPETLADLAVTDPSVVVSAASFWVGLRQEIYIAILTQQRVKLNLDHFIVDRSLEPANDYTWSNRAIILLADVLNSCFGDSPLTVRRWSALNDAAESWTMARPPSFNPFFYREGSGSVAFPEIWHGSSCHSGFSIEEQ